VLCARLLITAGASVNATNDHMATPLHIVARAAEPDVAARLVDLLVASGASLHTFDASSRTPLHVAVQRGEPAVVSALLNAGASPDAAAPSRDSAFTMAQRRADQAVLQAFAAARDSRRARE
jgi:ankyrin repeat protein